VTEENPEAKSPLSDDLPALVAEQHELIMKLRDTIAHQGTLIDELQEALRGRSLKGRRKYVGENHEGLEARVETILRLAEAEAADLREQARQAAAERIAAAEREAARIRGAAEMDAELKPEWLRGFQG
jgi:hypothetical protein